MASCIMMWRILTVTLLISISVLACSCGTRTTTVRRADNGAAVEINNGDFLRIVLDANPNSDYLWVLDAIDPKILRLRTKTLITLDEESAYGGNYFREFLFRAKQTGTTTVVIELTSLSDEGEPDYSMAEFEITVTVK